MAVCFPNMASFAAIDDARAFFRQLVVGAERMQVVLGIELLPTLHRDLKIHDPPFKVRRPCLPAGRLALLACLMMPNLGQIILPCSPGCPPPPKLPTIQLGTIMGDQSLPQRMHADLAGPGLARPVAHGRLPSS
ncbi:hypothetical protein [Geminicoccus roseus]|uniref:hypothetical protein n=1 Tax=Geminicoccus roseus TaxID=404900 RepID=UPI001F0A9163|nr:hypothetical protein [Geminicoccus roseus]